MKYNHLLKSGLGLLVIAGAMTPLASLGADGKYAYGEGALYDHLREVQSAQSMTPSPSGAEGPIRTEGMKPTATFGEGDLYDNLRNMQSEKSMTYGAEGPVRTESMASKWSFSGEGDLYDNLRNLQPSR